VLVEGSYSFFSELKVARPASLNLNMAACSETRWVNYTNKRMGTMSGVKDDGVQRKSGRTARMPCLPLGPTLSTLGVRHLDFVSVDVEGSELSVLRSLAASRLSMGVVVVEVRGDGQRRPILELLQRESGMRYVGQLNARGSSLNDVVDDVYVNLTHLRVYHPTSRALGGDGDAPCPTSVDRSAHDPNWYEICPDGLYRSVDGCVDSPAALRKRLQRAWRARALVQNASQPSWLRRQRLTLAPQNNII